MPTACSGAILIPDSGTVDPDSGLATWDPSDVGTWHACHGTDAPWSSIYDLSGNVREWTDSCQFETTANGGSWYCATRGGYYMEDQSEHYACDDPPAAPIGLGAYMSGFRCCRDLE